MLKTQTPFFKICCFEFLCFGYSDLLRASDLGFSALFRYYLFMAASRLSKLNNKKFLHIPEVFQLLTDNVHVIRGQLFFDGYLG